MTKIERVERTYRLESVDRPPFVPAIYEHKGRLIGKSPSQICRDEESLYQALLKEVEVYDPDMLVVGVDVYNVEAEAIGCEIVYFDDSDDVPGVASVPLKAKEDLGRLAVPDPETDGRMPMYLRVAERIQQELKGEMLVRGAVTGPFSLASELFGAERFILSTVDDPEFARRLMEFAAQATVRFGRAFIERGVDPIIFDSRAMPALSSPRVFKRLVAPVYREHVIPQLKEAGARHIPLIIGGDTTSILEDLIETGATQLLCDFEGDVERFKERCLAERRSFRGNVDPRLVHKGPVSEIRKAALRLLEKGFGHPGFLFGCGVVAYDCDESHVHALREALEDVAAGRVDFDRELGRLKGIVAAGAGGDGAGAGSGSGAGAAGRAGSSGDSKDAGSEAARQGGASGGGDAGFGRPAGGGALRKSGDGEIAGAEAIVSEAPVGYRDDLDPAMRELGEAIEEGDAELAREITEELLEDGFNPESILTDSMIAAMQVVGDRFARNEIFVPEMLLSARAMKAGLEILRPILTNTGVEPIASVILGTVKGDIHDIGKNLVGMMLEGAGFRVIDLGVNVSASTFIEAIREHNVHIIGMSALLTTTMTYMRTVVEALENEGLRDKVKVLVGGAPLSQEFADAIGADYYGENASLAVEAAKKALNDLKKAGLVA